jgi:hypothetical protein
MMVMESHHNFHELRHGNAIWISTSSDKRQAARSVLELFLFRLPEIPFFLAFLPVKAGVEFVPLTDHIINDATQLQAVILFHDKVRYQVANVFG